ncbi:DUF4097 domain-containing protein [Microbacterium sp. SLBN-146]|uniref:DUF4097 domain-containing protein n=1 Tax=Microbacterium sp. SLBN-146 TaxID=2768457 RepID=UPI001153B7BE|nr:DUF4097 domain-containing protein [Microbacterium sp. SLBN-146]TQJ30134.1 hypothetical protein FBY39_0579 [Microbacterium sp. SLBN-146]
MTTMTPPAPEQPVQPPAPAPASPSPAARAISIAAMALGGVLILGAVTVTVVQTVFSASASGQPFATSVAVAGVDELDADVSAGSLRIEFADIDEAELDVRTSAAAGQWSLTRDGDSLRVESPRLFGLGWLFGGAGDAVLRLPVALEGIDADFDLSAGDLRADGDFGELDLTVNAGRADLDATARDVSVEVNAGRADLTIDGAREGEFVVSAGEIVGALTGTPPQELAIEVSAGSLDLTVPEGDYDVRSDVSAGDFDNRIGSVPGASRVVTVSVSAGNATLRAE